MTLEAVAEDLWLAEGPIVSFYGFAYPTRMVIARLPSGALWIWSPIALDDDLKGAVAALGQPAHLVSPNPIHHLSLAAWKAAYPQAKLWGPAQTIAKRGDLRFEPALGDTPPTAWEGAIDQAWFGGSFVMEEILFFHRPSRTAILGDSSENFSAEWLRAHWPIWARPFARLWQIVEPYGYAPLEWRATFVKRGAAKAAARKAIAWNPERVIMAHGAWQRADGAAYLRRAFAWLLGDPPA